MDCGEDVANEMKCSNQSSLILRNRQTTWCVRKAKNDAAGVFCSADPCLVHASEKFKVCALADGTLAVLMFQAPAFFDEGLDDGCDRAFR